MQSAKKPTNEEQRLAALHSMNILDSLPEKDFDQITTLASMICNTPIALISLVDKERQWFKSKVGLKAAETHRDLAFCAHAILGNEAFVVPNSSLDSRFSDNPLVTGAPNVQFYAGAPLMSPEGYPIGTVCVIDSIPRELSPQQIESLSALSDQVTRLLKLRSQIKSLEQTTQNLQYKNKAFETILEGIVLQDASGTIVDFNPSAPTVLNLTADQLLGKTSLDPTWKAIREDGSEFPGHEHPAMVCLRSGKPQKNVIMGIRTSDQDTRWIKINSAPLLRPSEKFPSRVVTSFADITEEILAKSHLEEKSSKLRFVLDGIPSLIGLWGADLTNLEANSAYFEYFNKSPDEIRGTHMSELLGEELYRANTPHIKEVLAGKRVNFERVLKHRDGSERFTLVSYIPNCIDGKVTSFLANVVDITDIRKLETEQRKLEARLVESTKLSALGEMAAGIAHEINNPLTIIKGKSSLLARRSTEGGLNGESAKKDLKIIESTADRIVKIIKALRVYSRDAENDDPVPANLSEVLSDTLELCRERFINAGIALRIDCDELLMADCRPAQISQVFMNLLSNSFDAIIDLDDKWIEVKAYKRDGQIEFQFSDSGSGIAKSTAEKIMNPFFTTKEVGKGTGLGLSISNGIIQSHGGSLKYCENYKNTTFFLTLPVGKALAAPKAA